MLKSMLAIPRTPTPPPLEEREYENVNREDFLELQRQLRELKVGAMYVLKCLKTLM